jgi:hypothetical protein
MLVVLEISENISHYSSQATPAALPFVSSEYNWISLSQGSF